MAGTALGYGGPACPPPLPTGDRVQLGHGSGGRMSAVLLAEHFLPRLGNPVLSALGDGAVLPAGQGELVVSTDTFVVSPLEFPGGNIGSLAVHGTLNDVAMMGGRPRYFTAGFVLEEGLPLEVLDRVVAAMAASAAAAGVALVTGDTKVVERGKADGMFVNTTGIGELDGAFRPAPGRARPGDALILSGPLGRHGMAIMSAREGIELDGGIESDTAALLPLVERLRAAAGAEVHVLRDPTRGGLASALNEIAAASGTGMEIDLASVPVPPVVAAACEILGLDPLYVASEGVLVAVVDRSRAGDALAALQAEPLGREAAVIGRVGSAHPGMVVVRTPVGGRRVLDLLPGDQLPRIC
jgi:hydrogenase expression/formation protein HypE